MSHDMDCAYWAGNTAPRPYVIPARDANAFSGSFLLTPKICVQSPAFNEKSNCINWTDLQHLGQDKAAFTQQLVIAYCEQTTASQIMEGQATLLP